MVGTPVFEGTVMQFAELTQAFKQKRELREQSSVIGLFRAAVDAKGGVEKFGQDLVEDYNEVRHSENNHLKYQFHSLIQKLASEHDRVSGETADLSNVDEDDLKAVVTEAALELLAVDDDFLQACLAEAERRKASQTPERITCPTS